MTATNLIHPGTGIWAAHVLWGVTILMVVAALLSAAGRHQSTLRHRPASGMAQGVFLLGEPNWPRRSLGLGRPGRDRLGGSDVPCSWD